MVLKILLIPFLLLSAIPQLLICRAKDQHCVDPWLGSTIGLIDNCDLLKETFEVKLDKLINQQCVRAIGYKVKNETGWDKIINGVEPTKVIEFNTTEAFCLPLNLTVGVRFWNGTTHENRKVKTELNPRACLQKDLTSHEKESLKKRCPLFEDVAPSQEEKTPAIFGPWRDTNVCSESCGPHGRLLQVRSCSSPHLDLACVGLNVLKTGSTPCNPQMCKGI